jgi:hypothetical protein
MLTRKSNGLALFRKEKAARVAVYKFMTFLKKILIALFLLAFLSSAFTLANGGDQRVVDGKYLINLSRAPFTPHVNEKVSFLASFVDIDKNKLIREDLLVGVRIAKLGGIGTGKRTFLFEKEKIPVTGGVLELSYTFTESGLHEIFFGFAFASKPQKVYEAPDFLLDVQKHSDGYDLTQIIIATSVTFIIGLIAGWFIKTTVGRAVG